MNIQICRAFWGHGAIERSSSSVCKAWIEVVYSSTGTRKPSQLSISYCSLTSKPFLYVSYNYAKSRDVLDSRRRSNLRGMLARRGRMSWISLSTYAVHESNSVWRSAIIASMYTGTRQPQQRRFFLSFFFFFKQQRYAPHKGPSTVDELRIANPLVCWKTFDLPRIIPRCFQIFVNVAVVAPKTHTPCVSQAPFKILHLTKTLKRTSLQDIISFWCILLACSH
jgi:hypothetical protein